jgi:hypothetical protein
MQDPLDLYDRFDYNIFILKFCFHMESTTPVVEIVESFHQASKVWRL